MTPQDKHDIIITVTETIQKTVNGKIDGINAKMDKHIKHHDAFMERLEPVLDGLKWLNTSRKFIVWLGTPLITIGAVVAVIKGWILR